MICGGITMEEMSIQSMCACAASVRETSTSETTPSLTKISTTPGSPFRSDLALSICGRVTSPPSSRTLSTYSSLCCTWENAGGARSLPQNRQISSGSGFGYRAAMSGQRSTAVPTNLEIIPQSHSSRDCAVYRHRGPAELPDDKREVEAERQPGWALRTQALPVARLFRWQLP
jgi:hypothetical protein